MSKVLNVLKDLNILLVFLALFILFVLVINNSLVGFAHLLTSKLHCD